MRHTEKLYAAKLAASMTPSNAGTPGASQAQAQSSALGRGLGAKSFGPMAGVSPPMGLGGGAAPKDVMSTNPVATDSSAVGWDNPQPSQGYGINAQIQNIRQQSGPPGPARGPSNPNPYAEMARNAGGMFSGMGPAALGYGGAYSNHAPGPEIFSNTPSAGADPRSFMANAGGALGAINPYMRNMGKALSGIGRAGAGAFSGIARAGAGAFKGMMNGPTEAQRAGVTQSNEIDRRTNSPEHQNAIQAQNTPGTPAHNALQEKINAPNPFADFDRAKTTTGAGAGAAAGIDEGWRNAPPPNYGDWLAR